jgi:hypothetical protein
VDKCDQQPIAALEGLTTRRESREILRRSRRVASAINGHSREEQVVQAVYLLLSQEGALVGEFVEEIAARAFQHQPLPARHGLSTPGAAGRLQAKTGAELASVSPSVASSVA